MKCLCKINNLVFDICCLNKFNLYYLFKLSNNDCRYYKNVIFFLEI